MRIILLALITLFVSCSSSKKATLTNTPSSGQNDKQAAATSQDGSSYATAIIIKEKSSLAGIDAEYAWVRENYPDSRVTGQSLQHKNGKSYDVLTVQTSSGKTQRVYFDITSFFGKW